VENSIDRTGCQIYNLLR